MSLNLMKKGPTPTVAHRALGYLHSSITATIFFVVLGLPIAIFAIFGYFFPYLAIAYLFWISKDKAGSKDGRRFEWYRNLAIWKYISNYFPCELIFDDYEEIKKHKQVLMGSSPHGIIGVATQINFGTNANAISDLMPAITPVTLASNFKLPIIREFLLAFGFQSVSKKSCDYILSRGRSLLIVIGGAQEAMYVSETNYKLIIKQRRGFFKLAIKHGVPLVPVFNFGENSVYTYVPSPTWDRLQSLIKNAFGIVMPLFHGRRYRKGWSFVPHKQPLITIIGKPILVNKDFNPTNDEINRLQDLYVKELERLFFKYRGEYGPHIKKLTFC